MTNRTMIYEPVARPHHAKQHAPQELDGLAGKVIGFIDNAKPNFNLLIDDLEALLTTKYGAAAVLRRSKRGPMRAAPEATIKELAGQCDIIITGAGD